MDKLIAYLSQRGNQTRLAAALGISKTQVNGWLKGKRPVPLVYMARIELVSMGQVTRKDLCPGWQEHWPELADPSSTRETRALIKRAQELMMPKKQRLCTTIEPSGGCDARTKLMRTSI